jgi:hypothetical protein
MKLCTNLSSIPYMLQAPPISRTLDLTIKIITGDVHIFEESQHVFLSILHFVFFLIFIIFLLL